MPARTSPRRSELAGVPDVRRQIPRFCGREHGPHCWARSRLKQGFSLDAAADAVGSSKRTLARRMQTVLGKSPLSYFQSLRVERAVHLLKTSSASVDDIAARVGYSEGSILRVLLRRRLGIGIKEIRRSA